MFFTCEVKLFGLHYSVSNTLIGCSISHAVGWRFLTLEAWVKFQVVHMEFVVEK